MKSYKQKKIPDMFKVTENKLKEKSNGKEKRRDDLFQTRKGRREDVGKGREETKWMWEGEEK